MHTADDRKPRILYLSQYFPPEVGATQERALEMARAWVRLGAEVTMVCEVPNHPSGIIAPGFRGKLVVRDRLDGIEVIRVWVATSPKKSFVRRMLFYGSYMVHATMAGLMLARGPFDLIYATSPPLFVGGAALALSTLRRTPLVFEVRDLWPASAVAMGELSSSHAIRWAERLEAACYRRARRVVVVAEGAEQHLIDAGIDEAKLLLVPNGSNTELFRFDGQARTRLRDELGLKERFVVIYAGMHGLAQRLETVVEAAELLRSQTDVHFLLIGDGPRKEAILSMVRELELENLTMLDEKARELVSGCLSAADLALVPMRDAGVLGATMLPVKIFDAWACERPVLLSGGEAAARMVQEAGGGATVPAEDPEGLAAAVLELRDQPESRRRMGEHGRRYTVDHHSRAALAEGLWGELQQLIGGAAR